MRDIIHRYVIDRPSVKYDVGGWKITQYSRNLPNFLELGPDCIEGERPEDDYKLRLDVAQGVINFYVKTGKRSNSEIDTLLSNLPQGGKRVSFSKEIPTLDNSKHAGFVVYKNGWGYDYELYQVDPNAGTIKQNIIASAELMCVGIQMERNCDAVLPDLLKRPMTTHLNINPHRLCALSFDQGDGTSFLVLWDANEMLGILQAIDNLIMLPPTFRILLDDMAIRAKGEENYIHDHLVNYNKQERRLKLWEYLVASRSDYQMQDLYEKTMRNLREHHKDIYYEMVELERVNTECREADCCGQPYSLPADLSEWMISSATRKPLLKQRTIGYLKFSMLPISVNQNNRIASRVEKKALNLTAVEYDVDYMTALQEYLDSVSDQLMEVTSKKDHVVRQYNSVNVENPSVTWIESKSIVSTDYQDKINVFELLRCGSDVAFRVTCYSSDLGIKAKLYQLIEKADWMGMSWTINSSRKKRVTDEHNYIVLDINHCKTPVQYQRMLSLFDAIDSIIALPSDFKADSKHLLQEDALLASSTTSAVMKMGVNNL